MRTLFLLLVLWVPISGHAQMYGAGYEKCNAKTTVEIVDCLGASTRQWDQRLNASYKALMTRSDTSQQASLKAAQLLWIRYRDANCQFYAAGQGSISAIESAECLRSMTQARTCELQSASQREGGPRPECNRR